MPANKKNITNNIYSKIGISNDYSKQLLNDTLSIIINLLKKYKIVKIKNFGTFKVLKKNERIGRNPKTQETLKISSRKTVSFKSSSSISSKLRAPRF